MSLTISGHSPSSAASCRPPQHNHLHLHGEVPSREEAIEAARECLEVFAPHLLAVGPSMGTTGSFVHPKVNRPVKAVALILVE
jgi:hypothetical protein